MNTELKRNGVKDVAFSITGLLIFNCTIQFIIYPFLNNQIGANSNGIMLSMLSIIAIMAGSIGTGTNYSRMVNHLSRDFTNGDYNVFLLIAGALCILCGTVYLFITKDFYLVQVLLFGILMFFTLLRIYADVEFRLHVDFKSYLLYYILISVGYCAGMLFYLVTKQWMIIFISGEIVAVIFVALRGTIFSPPRIRLSENHQYIWKSASILSASEFITYLIQNEDRLLILFFLNGTAVTAFYVASLFGKTLSMLTQPINSVLISYLIRYKGHLTKKILSIVFVLVLALSAVAFAACMLVTPFFVKLLYPDVYAVARPLFWSAILGQVFFFSSNVLLTILLRFFGEANQLIINLIYAIVFVLFTIPALIFFGLIGFSYAVLLVNAFKLFFCFAFGLKRSSGKKGQLLNE